MIELMVTHPQYNFLMEVLCALPRAPLWCTIGQVMRDVHIATPKGVYLVLYRVRKLGFGIHTFNKPNVGRAVHVERSSWPAVFIETNRYWRAVLA
ncbi:MAG: hypothetical protein V3V75_04600 [Thermoguttaceae bacterium]